MHEFHHPRFGAHHPPGPAREGAAARVRAGIHRLPLHLLCHPGTSAPHPHATPHRYATSGNFFGDFEYYRRSLRLARYQASRHCTLYSIDFAHVQEAVDEHFDAGLGFMNTLKKRFKAFDIVLQEPPQLSFQAPIKPTKAKPQEGTKHGDSLSASVHGSVRMESTRLSPPTDDNGFATGQKKPSFEPRSKGGKGLLDQDDGRRRTRVFGTKSVRLRTSSLQGAATPAAGKSAGSASAGSIYVDGEHIYNESVDDAMAAEAVMNFTMNSRASDQRYPCVVGVNRYGKVRPYRPPSSPHLGLSWPLSGPIWPPSFS